MSFPQNDGPKINPQQPQPSIELPNTSSEKNNLTQDQINKSPVISKIADTSLLPNEKPKEQSSSYELKDKASKDTVISYNRRKSVIKLLNIKTDKPYMLQMEKNLAIDKIFKDFQNDTVISSPSQIKGKEIIGGSDNDSDSSIEKKNEKSSDSDLSMEQTPQSQKEYKIEAGSSSDESEKGMNIISDDSSEKVEIDSDSEVDHLKNVKEEINVVVMNLSSQNPQHILKIGHHEYLISLGTDSKNVDFISIYKKIDLLGIGAFGIIHSYLNIDTNDIYAMKFAKATDKAREDVKNEFEQLWLYNPRGKDQTLKPGIQAPPHLVLSVNGEVGYLGVKYKGDGGDLREDVNNDTHPLSVGLSQEEFDNLMLKNKNEIMEQLIEGSNYLISIEQCHLDVKDKNFLFNGNIRDGFTVVHSDFGGDVSYATIMDKIDTINLEEDFSVRMFLPTHTPSYIPSLYVYDIDNWIKDIISIKSNKNLTNEEKEINVKPFKDAIQTRLGQISNFALALCLIEIYTGSMIEVESFKKDKTYFGAQSADITYIATNEDYLSDINTCVNLMDLFEVPNEVKETILTMMGMNDIFSFDEEGQWSFFNVDKEEWESVPGVV